MSERPSAEESRITADSAFASRSPRAPRAPSTEEILLELRRRHSTVRILASEWPDGHRGATVAFLGLKVDTPRWRHVHFQSGEVRRIAASLLALADRESW